MGLALVLPDFSVVKLRFALALGLVLGACKPGIGDACTTSTDCSQTGDRLCDISQPFGYCTIYNCEPAGTNASTACPDDSACIAFAAEPSPVDGCANALGATPYQRTFCLKKCDNNNDCRDQYVCADLAADPRFAAVDIDGRTKVCTVKSTAPAPKLKADPEMSEGGASPGVSSEVCTGSSNGDSMGVPTAGSGAGGEPSAGGGGGVSGAP